MASSDDGVEIESEEELEVAATEGGARQLRAGSSLGELKEEKEEKGEAGEAEEEVEEIDPSTLGVPGLRTLSFGDRIDVLWSNGAL